MRTQALFNDGWLFHEGDITVPETARKSPLYIQAKTECKRCGPAARDYLDSHEHYGERGLISHETWARVDLPHDYAILQRPDEHNNEALGFFKYDNAWYRKHFTLPELDDNARVRLYFEGVATHCRVYVNGCYMLTNECGYTSFEVDITDVVDFGAENVVAVYVDTSEHEGWWYEGAGIYRNIWLDISDAASLTRDGVFVHPERISDCVWNLPVDVEIRNDGFAAANINVECVARDMAGQEVARMSGDISVPARSTDTLNLTKKVLSPALWDTESPNLYTLTTTLSCSGRVIDESKVRFGFRTIRFDAREGFFLNDRPVKIKGVCCHQDYGLTGKAVPERVQRYRLELLREMGANGYRCSHYPQHAYTMDMLDELGFLVLAETRWYASTPSAMAQLDMLIRRDRNHPSVILWSAGNEEPFHLTQAGKRIARAMFSRIRELDGTRPVTTAVSHDPISCAVLDDVDVIGVNYNMEQIDAIHAKYPDKPFISTENCATGTTRGWYLADARGYIRGYDHDTNKSFLSREHTWQAFMARPWVCGGYQWAGIEHRGEALWPRLCSQSGAIDLYLNRKDAFYQNQSYWLSTPMLHILPHWNWQGREGEPIDVWVYTNCQEVELLLNGKSLGRQSVAPITHAAWSVPYEPGALEARGYTDGAEVCHERIETTGAPVALRLRLESDGVRADGRDAAIITCDCVDAQGRHVPDAAPLVQFDSSELGRIAGTGSDVCDHEPVWAQHRRMRAGLVSVLGRAGTRPGTWRIYAHADGLRAARLDIELK